MCKKIVVFLVVCMMMSAVAGCGGSENDSKQTVNAQAQNSEADNKADSEEEKTAEVKIGKGKAYAMRRADNDKLEIELLYRNGSDKVAKITGLIVAPAGSAEYDGMVADNAAFEKKVEALNLPEDIMHFSYDEVKLENGYVSCNFVFSELDAENADSVDMVAEFLGLPVSNGSFSLSECDAYFQNAGIELDSEW